MRRFQEIYEISAERQGGAEAVEAKIDKPKPAEALAAIPEDRWLSELSKFVFRTGMNWKVIEAKWEGTEQAFHGFDPDWCAMMDDTRFDALVTDTRIVRHGGKIASVRDNAVMIREMRADGGIGRIIADWPSTDFSGLIAMLKERGSRLGGSTAQYGLRYMGRDSFILSKDVVGRLIAEGVIDKAPTSKSAMAAVQAAFNTWMEQSGRSLTEVSRVLAMSAG